MVVSFVLAMAVHTTGRVRCLCCVCVWECVLCAGRAPPGFRAATHEFWRSRPRPRPRPDDDDFVALFRDHIIGLRSHPWLARADIVFIGECNGNYNVGLLVQAVSDVERFMPVRQKPGGKYGWTTTKVNKIEYSNSQRLQFGYGSVRFLHNAVCTNRAEPAASRLEETKAKLIAQLREYRPVPTKPKTAHASSSITHSGKTDEDGNIVSGKNDDLVIALCMNAHMWQKAKQRELPCVNYDRLAVALAAS